MPKRAAAAGDRADGPAHPLLGPALRDPVYFRLLRGGVCEFYYGHTVGQMIRTLSQAFGSDWPAAGPYVLGIASTAIGPRAVFKSHKESTVTTSALLWELDVCPPGGTKTVILTSFNNVLRAVELIIEVSTEGAFPSCFCFTFPT